MQEHIATLAFDALRSVIWGVEFTLQQRAVNTTSREINVKFITRRRSAPAPRDGDESAVLNAPESLNNSDTFGGVCLGLAILCSLFRVEIATKALFGNFFGIYFISMHY
ncbi:hypothetical protein EVAR_60782_1 [Eumeta japonica]|uniref:Uncharacterized protein n=1 Tax=Eumeta variegata TaxID=151549 RepID=A0A4C1ZTD2_EUMVA|nr:hypothetical protein EVAR_60782_1 [Eumeta japonica]